MDESYLRAPSWSAAEEETYGQRLADMSDDELAPI